MIDQSMNIVEAGLRDIPTVRELFLEYQRAINVDLCFQNFDRELAELPGSYAPPGGALLLAVADGAAVGCVGFRPGTDNEAELKRLYVRPSHRGRGVGRELFLAAMSRAREAGYDSIVLETLPSMTTARAMYQAHGFVQIPACCGNSQDGAEYYRYAFV